MRRRVLNTGLLALGAWVAAESCTPFRSPDERRDAGPADVGMDVVPEDVGFDVPDLGWPTSVVGLWQNGTATFILSESNNTPDGGQEAGQDAEVRVVYGAMGDRPLLGDWDGDGHQGLGVFRPTSTLFLLSQAVAPSVPEITLTFGATGDLPIVGDWDDDGRDDIGTYRPALRTFYFRSTLSDAGLSPANDPLVLPFDAGTPNTTIPVVGDWDGNGTVDLGVFQPATRTFVLTTNARAQPVMFRTFTLLSPACTGVLLPVAGDWDANGVDTVGLWCQLSGALTLVVENSGGDGGAPTTVQRTVIAPGAGNLPVVWRIRR